MNFVADESIDQAIVAALRKSGHNVQYVAELAPGISDSMILDSANKTSSVIITADKDFGDLVYRQKYLNPGIILLRLAGLSRGQKVEIVINAITQYGDNLLGKFSVISPSTMRIRNINFH